MICTRAGCNAREGSEVAGRDYGEIGWVLLGIGVVVIRIVVWVGLPVLAAVALVKYLWG